MTLLFVLLIQDFFFFWGGGGGGGLECSCLNTSFSLSRADALFLSDVYLLHIS
jgi:hypothetical protein